MRPTNEKGKLEFQLVLTILKDDSCRCFFSFYFLLLILKLFKQVVVAIKNLVIPGDIILCEDFNREGERYQFSHSESSPVYYIVILVDIELKVLYG